MKSPLSLEELRQRFNQNEAFKFLYFWGHQPSKNGGITASCFSQWYNAGFTVEDITYPTAEHYMMAEKAHLFNDNETRQAILTAKKPGAAKALGRKVKHFDENIWLQHRFSIVCQASYYKFSQNAALKTYLLNTGERVLVEASPVDFIWGIGLAADHPYCANPNYWEGLNLLGFALMHTREKLENSG